MSDAGAGVTLPVMIEIPKGSRNRYEYDKEKERVRFDRHFFSIYKDLEEKEVRVEGWDDRNAAMRVVKEARERYVDGGGGP